MTEAAFWWVNTVTVEPYLGSGAYGPTYGSPVTVDCWLDDATKLVRDSNGDQVVSSSTVHAAVADAAKFPPLSKVTTPTRTALVISIDVEDSGTLDMEIDHIAVALT